MFKISEREKETETLRILPLFYASMHLHHLDRSSHNQAVAHFQFIEIDRRVSVMALMRSRPTIRALEHLLSVTVEDDDMMVLHEDIVQAILGMRREGGRYLLQHIHLREARRRFRANTVRNSHIVVSGILRVIHDIRIGREAGRLIDFVLLILRVIKDESFSLKRVITLQIILALYLTPNEIMVIVTCLHGQSNAFTIPDTGRIMRIRLDDDAVRKIPLVDIQQDGIRREQLVETEHFISGRIVVQIDQRILLGEGVIVARQHNVRMEIIAQAIVRVVRSGGTASVLRVISDLLTVEIIRDSALDGIVRIKALAVDHPILILHWSTHAIDASQVWIQLNHIAFADWHLSGNHANLRTLQHIHVSGSRIGATGYGIHRDEPVDATFGLLVQSGHRPAGPVYYRQR